MNPKETWRPSEQQAAQDLDSELRLRRSTPGPVPEQSTLPPSNRLSDAPSASQVAGGPEARFFDSVRPSALSAVFQPIVRLATSEVFAYEALVRCALPKYASPLDLFRGAVDANATGRLGRMIREIAVPLCAGIPLFVNLHPSELEAGWLVRPDDPIFSHDHDIFLEITESAPITHFDLCSSVLREVCSRACAHLVLDDFGAGYSNLKLIADLEPKVVKLDRALVQDLDKKPRLQKLAANVVRLCSELGAVVVAEGIETRGELSAVRDSGAQYGQGFLLASPGYPLPRVHWPSDEKLAPPERSSRKIRI